MTSYTTRFSPFIPFSDYGETYIDQLARYPNERVGSGCNNVEQNELSEIWSRRLSNIGTNHYILKANNVVTTFKKVSKVNVNLCR